jgi:hypothetical protein
MPSVYRYEDIECDQHDNQDDDVDGRLAFPSTFGRIPVNAITGRRYSFQLGSAEQLRLFEVRSCACELDCLGVPLSPGAEPDPDPIRLFYDNPKQYLAHRAALLGMGPSEEDVEHMMRRGYGSQPRMDLANWAEMTRLWKSRQIAKE